VPFLGSCRATPLDIFNFFESYDVITESLQLGVDALGRPSGEAWLTFTSSEEALRAVRERNRHYLGNRYLELSLT
jgi:heterogeneous nuclear ribonucleoprotein F/H/epithelial splicing regulatory protein 1/2